MPADRLGNRFPTGKLLARGYNRVLAAIALAYRSLATAVISTIRNIVNAITGAIRSIANGITSAIRGIANGITSAFRSIGNAITGAFRSIINFIINTYRSIVNGITGAFRRIGNTITSAFRSTVNAITRVISAITGALVGVWRKTALAIRVGIRATLQGIARVFQRIKMGLGRMVFRMRSITLTLSVENGVIRAVAFRGTDVIAWTTSSLDDPPDQEETAAPPEEEAGESPAGDTSPLRRLLKEMPSGRARLVTDMPMYAPLIRQLHLPKVSSRYRQRMILSEVLDTIPFEPEEVDVSWQIRQDSEGDEAFAIAVPKGQVDSQVQMVKEANLSPAAAYTKATALAFAIGIPDAIVLHLEQDRVATVLVHESTPQIVHQQEFPWNSNNPQEQAAALAAAVDQVAGYYQARGPGSENDPLPVVLTGKMPDEDQVMAILPQVLGRPVLPFAPTVDYPEDFPQDDYAANLGLLLADQARSKRWGASDGSIGPALDVLPQRYRPRPLPLVPIGVFIALFLLVGLAVMITGPVSDKVSEADQLSLRRDTAQNEEREQLAIQVARLGQQRELEEAQQQALGMESGLGQLQLIMDRLVNGLLAITEGTSNFGIELSGVAPHESGFALAGTGGSYNEVFAYSEALRASDLLEEAAILQLTGSGEGTVAFSILASVPQPVEEEPETGGAEGDEAQP